MSGPRGNPSEEIVMTPEGIRVQIGQVWRDLDPRQDGRTVKIMEIINRDPQQAKVLVRTSKGVESKISVRRMRRNSTGYELVK